jgi:Arc/MetJ-type ribon-helix-helix transcriptional regulator
MAGASTGAASDTEVSEEPQESLPPAPLKSYTHPMAITLDPAIEQRIQQQLDRGAFREPAELLAHALDLVEAEAEFDQRRTEWVARLEQSCAQADRGEGYTEEEHRARMAELRASQPLSRTA